MEPTAASKGHRWALVSVVAIKDTEARGKAVPMPLRRRRLDGPAGADPLCAYDALLAAWTTRQEMVPAAERKPGGASSTPFFTGDDGGAWT
eukprot:636142-Pleurochrysis_carterae.AAC.1